MGPMFLRTWRSTIRHQRCLVIRRDLARLYFIHSIRNRCRYADQARSPHGVRIEVPRRPDRQAPAVSAVPYDNCRVNLRRWVGLSPARAAAIRSLPTPFTLNDLRSRGFLLHRERVRRHCLELFYAPFDWINRKALVVLVGITPGWHQTDLAFQEAHTALHEGCSPRQVCHRAKNKASFAGPMRTNLVEMLDDLGLARHLAIGTTDALFSDPHSRLVHTASVSRFPVFVNGKNYTGSRPNLLKTPILRRVATEVLAQQLAEVPKALVVPFGKVVADVLEVLVQEGKLGQERYLRGFPHPSGANGHRIAEFDRTRRRMRWTLSQWFSHRSGKMDEN
jgi:hypothetical protein